jgi:hypothetical protein
MADDQGATPVVEDLPEGTDLADRVVVPGLDDRERLVQADGLTVFERRGLDVR